MIKMIVSTSKVVVYLVVKVVRRGFSRKQR